MVGNSDSDIEKMRTINKLIEEQTKIDTRVERLESLEFHNRAFGLGCVSFVDWDFPAYAASATVDMPPAVATVHPYIQANIFWEFWGNAAQDIVDLHMTIDALAVNYQYAYKFSKGGVATHIGLDNQTEWFAGRMGGRGRAYAMGHIFIPFYSRENFPAALGDWTFHDVDGGANAKQEKGEWGGHNTYDSRRLQSITFAASAGLIRGAVYLYLWCPQEIDAGGPPD